MPDSTHLSEAASTLESAAADVDGDAADRLDRLAGQLRDLVDSGRTPDHGRLDRMLNALSEVESSVDGDAADAVDRAREQITTYREGVSGV
ncbi:MAG: hypothetical protein ABEJ23_10685 [Haloarculaceae archaeon]